MRPGMAFEPRSVLSVPSAFGRVQVRLSPADGIDADDHRYRASMVQHLVASMIHHSLRLRGETLPQFLTRISETPGTSPDRVRRILRGETAMQLADLAFWSSHFPQIPGALAKHIASWAPKWMTETDGGEEL